MNLANAIQKIPLLMRIIENTIALAGFATLLTMSVYRTDTLWIKVFTLVILVAIICLQLRIVIKRILNRD